MKAKAKDGKRSERGFSERSRQVALSAAKGRMRVMELSTPLVVKISLNVADVFESPNFI